MYLFGYFGGNSPQMNFLATGFPLFGGGGQITAHGYGTFCNNDDAETSAVQFPFHDFLANFLNIKRIPSVGSAQNRAPQVSDAPYSIPVKMNEIIVFQQAPVAKAAAVNFSTPVHGGQHNGPNDRI
jgi:hypothetical protein